ncbi:hypothetical protein A2130_03120 [Candidatus Woesebacteria bacterium GWC2_33_12]|uniref:Uncharacterized protein n=1 Tax=Candidatus Woesebacteria bacterium GW2011_GWB1_33_22 TaxID=1618566 RepID=A0A0F9ZX31_9BACT|nr:MAG: hypothetical protein UR29_C0023G0007 [Candidatus Woesebacteria bacterium GW2011_GWC2_33_12]KKP41362.1 MAG: hypothetical protein UR33_C0019G0007 [Candidatus Woesebacteria bacterium GW2011_GWA2_33_20]KKP43541.1 MAG: hypothetical protein UR35_C0019G0007 [Candidatus Woesebacteria bacterium GW2011_GWB1_33_22]OGM07429.1 MAG: hypothetical protein A2130_03120 [Candidatus Woesebacteria bacterium GWC2_33_12]OGM78647.1 MAG: hypothetical protein A2366_02870 [Candidatus Woesebacteria bacterium RIFOX
MTLQLVSYKPFAKNQWERIIEMWRLYKESIGLEGDIGISLVRKGKNQREIDDAIALHRDYIKNNLDEWHKLRKEG